MMNSEIEQYKPNDYDKFMVKWSQFISDEHLEKFDVDISNLLRVFYLKGRLEVIKEFKLDDIYNIRY